ncbi:polyprenyl synthetase family protein, partial [Vibrio rotiferianus]
YTSDGEDMGKNVGDDLAEGKPTLPLLHAMRNSTPDNAQMIREAIEKANGMDRLEEILAVMQAAGSLEYTTQRALDEADKAIAELAILPESEYKQALITLAHMAVKRTS